MRYTWLMLLKVGKHLCKPVNLHLSPVTSQKSFMIASGIVRSLTICIILLCVLAETKGQLFLMPFSSPQALYFQFGIKLHNVVDTQVSPMFCSFS